MNLVQGRVVLNVHVLIITRETGLDYVVVEAVSVGVPACWNIPLTLQIFRFKLLYTAGLIPYHIIFLCIATRGPQPPQHQTWIHALIIIHLMESRIVLIWPECHGNYFIIVYTGAYAAVGSGSASGVL